jgi:hypothetical protein
MEIHRDELEETILPLRTGCAATAPITAVSRSPHQEIEKVRAGEIDSEAEMAFREVASSILIGSANRRRITMMP